MKQLPIVIAIATLFPATQLYAQDILPSSKSAAVTAQSLPQDTDIIIVKSYQSDPIKSPSNFSVITEEELLETQASDIKQLLRYEPGITVRKVPYSATSAAGGGGRGGNEGINIRGLEGNRVIIMEDGISLPASYSFGSFFSGRGDYINSDMYNRVEILRGPTSALWGSDGLTGGINFVTKDPKDYLNIFNRTSYISLRTFYDSSQKSRQAVLTTAIGNDTVQGMLMMTTGKSSELKNQGDIGESGISRTKANPQDLQKNGILGKVVVHISNVSKIKLSLDNLRQETDSIALTALGPSSSLMGVEITDLRESDTIKRDKAVLNYTFHNEQAAWIQKMSFNVAYQKSNNTQQLLENRKNGILWRERDNRYAEKSWLTNALFNSLLRAGETTHYFTYGIDYKNSDIRSLNMGKQHGGGGAVFPNKYFPDTTYSTIGLFIQDEIIINKLSIIPALRFDYYKLDPNREDTIYLNADSLTVKPIKLSDKALSPRVGILYEIIPQLIPYFQYSKGFKAPEPFQVNNGFTNSAHGYMTISNAELKAESSNSYEIGIKGRLATTDAGHFQYAVAGFYGQYKNFIDLHIKPGVPAPVGITSVYQYENLDEADIYGSEAQINWWHNSGVNVKLGVAYAKGHTKSKGDKKPLESINPLTVNFGARFEPNQTWYVGGDVRFQMAKKEKDTNPSSGLFLPSSAAVVDLKAGYRFKKHVSVYANINNILDKKYWNWSDVRGRSANTPIDFYSAPGRSFSIGIKTEF